MRSWPDYLLPLLGLERFGRCAGNRALRGLALSMDSDGALHGRTSCSPAMVVVAGTSNRRQIIGLIPRTTTRSR